MNKPQHLNEAIEKLLLKRIRQLSSPLEPKPTGISERLEPLKNIRAVLFDVYGTLFIAGVGDIGIANEMSNEQAVAEALQSAGFSGNLEEAGAKGKKLILQAIRCTHEKRRTQGISYPEVDIRDEWHTVLTSLQQEHLIEGEISAEAIMRVSVEYECRMNPVWPMPDLEETLHTLKEKQFVLGIVSNAQFYSNLLLFPAFLGKSPQELGFDQDLCAWSFESQEAKPSVNLFHGVVERLQHQHGISPEEALYVGNDKLNDMWPAAQLGLKTVLFAGDRRSLRLREDDTRCSTLEPDVIITKLSQLSQVLG